MDDWLERRFELVWRGQPRVIVEIGGLFASCLVLELKYMRSARYNWSIPDKWAGVIPSGKRCPRACKPGLVAPLSPSRIFISSLGCLPLKISGVPSSDAERQKAEEERSRGPSPNTHRRPSLRTRALNLRLDSSLVRRFDFLESVSKIDLAPAGRSATIVALSQTLSRVSGQVEGLPK